MMQRTRIPHINNESPLRGFTIDFDRKTGSINIKAVDMPDKKPGTGKNHRHFGKQEKRKGMKM